MSTIAGLEPGFPIVELTESCHPILVCPGSGNLMEDSYSNMTLRVLNNNAVHENAFWFAMVGPQPTPVHLPVSVNPVFGNKGRVVQ